MTCQCGPQWTVWAVDMRTGQTLRRLDPVSIEISRSLSEPFAGQVTFDVCDVDRLRAVWPHLTTIVVVREGLPAMAGWVDAAQAEAIDGGGTLQVGLQSFMTWLDRRHLDFDRTWTGARQSQIAAELVNEAADDTDIMVSGVPIGSDTQVDWQQTRSEFLTVGDHLRLLSSGDTGLEWTEQVVQMEGGRWEVQMLFADRIGTRSDSTVGPDADVVRLGVDGIRQASHVAAVNTKPDPPVFAEADDGGSPYPRFDRTVTFDGPAPGGLNATALRLAQRWREPEARLTLGWVGDAGIQMGIGQTVNVDVCRCAIVYRGRARVQTIVWRASTDMQDVREVTFRPTTRPSRTMLDEPACTGCRHCT